MLETPDARYDAAPSRDGPPRESEALRADISATRSRMSETLDELGERLNPHVIREEITERVKEGIRGATIGRVQKMARHTADRMHDTRLSMMDAVRDNPLPAAMIGVGLAWLFMNEARSRPARDRRDRYDRIDDERWDTYDLDFEDDRGRHAGSRVDRLRERTAGMAEEVKEKSAELVDRAQDAAERAGERAREVAGRVKHKAADMAGDVARTSRRQVWRLEDYYGDNPLVLGVAALGAGLAVGMGVPPTKAEARLMGEKRDDFVEKVRDVVDEKKTQVEHVAERVYEEGKRVAREAARDEGLTAP